MKLDFFNRFFGRDVEERKPEVIDSRELRNWLAGQTGSRKEGIYRDCRSLIDGIFRIAGEVKTATLELEGLECHEGMHKKARKIIATSKPKFIRGVLDVLSSLGRKPQGYDELLVFSENLQSTLSTLAKLNMGEGRYLPMAFGEEIDAIKKAAKNLAENAEELQGMIGSDVALLSKVLGSLDEIDRCQDELEELDARKNEVEERINVSQEEASKLEGELDSLYDTWEFKELAKAGEDLDTVEDNLESVKSQIYSRLNPLKKPMRKLRKFAEVKGYSSAFVKDIDNFLHDPVEFFLSDNSGSLQNMFSEIRNMEFKPKERDKILGRIDLALEMEEDKLRDKHSKLLSLRCELKERIESSSITEKKTRINRDIERLNREKEDTADELGGIEKKAKDIEGRISAIKEGLEDRINEIEGYKIKINWTA